MANEEWVHWARERHLLYQPLWPAMATAFRGGGLHRGGMRTITRGFSGTFGGLPCFGYLAGAGADPSGELQIVGLRLAGVTFPMLSLQEADFVADEPGIPIEEEFDLRWRVSAAHHGFARDVMSEAARRLLIDVVPDFSHIWFERDAVLLSARGDVSTAAVDRYLGLLRALVDAIPSRVLDALRPRPFAPALPAYQQVSRQPVAPPMIARTQLVSWRVWAARRGWLYYDNAREIVERFNHGPVPGGRFTDAFVGKFGTLPCFGWRWIAGTGPRPQVRHVICLRQPGLTFPTVRLTQEDALLAELVGRGDIEVGDPTFDDRWRVTAEEPEAAREVLTPGVWRLFASPQLPPFGQVWFERDVAAVVTEGPIAPESVDGYLRFLHDVMGAVAD